MECSLKKKIPSEHMRKEEPRYNVFLNCPLMNGKQICLWCCLHTCAIGEPLHRGDNALNHPDYEAGIPRLSDKENWDEIWHVCSSCSKG